MLFILSAHSGLTRTSAPSRDSIRDARHCLPERAAFHKADGLIEALATRQLEESVAAHVFAFAGQTWTATNAVGIGCANHHYVPLVRTRECLCAMHRAFTGGKPHAR